LQGKNKVDFGVTCGFENTHAGIGDFGLF